MEVWGVALAADATFITVSGVNEDMMFIRHRASQTLFLSNALTVHRDPLSTKTPHLAVHVGEAVCAHDDALSRASKLEVRRREGTLPASFRYPFQNDIDLLKSDLTFNELSRSYELSIGKFLPPNLFVRILRLCDIANSNALISEIGILVRKQQGLVQSCHGTPDPLG